MIWGYFQGFSALMDSAGTALGNITSGGLRRVGVTVDDPHLLVAQGMVSDTASLNKFGRNSDIDTGSNPEDVWDGGGIWVAPTAARTHDIASDDANDTSAGTGARTVTIFGLDSSWDLQTETVTMNGTSNVATANTYWRIFRMFVASAGSSETNEGTVTATAQTDATVTAQINPENGQTLMAIYTVPADTTLYLSQAYATINKSGGTSGAMCDMAIYVRDGSAADRAWQVKQFFGLSVTGTSSHQHHWKIPFSVQAKHDIRFTCVEVTDNNTDISAGFGGVLVDD